MMKKRLRIQSAVSTDSGLILIEGNRKKRNYHTTKEKISNGSASERILGSVDIHRSAIIVAAMFQVAS